MSTQTEQTEKPAQKSLRTGLYLSGKVHGWALKMMEKKGFEGNFSSYVADLIRRDWEGNAGNKTDTQPMLFPESQWNSPFAIETPYFPAFSQ